jgi:adenylosuccinate lyase
VSNVIKGLQRLDVAGAAIAADLEDNWEVLGEAIQMVMRAEAVAGTAGLDDPYERLKDLTRGRRVDAARMREFVSGLGLGPEAEQRMLGLTPSTYTGIADRLVDHLGS